MNADTLQIVIIVFSIGIVVTAGRLMGAIAKRIAAVPQQPRADLPTRAETDQLRDHVERLTGEVAELQERVDFTERLLAKQRDSERLKG
jgi:uncharacterized protein YlxW (UPF0749 family)